MFCNYQCKLKQYVCVCDYLILCTSTFINSMYVLLYVYTHVLLDKKLFENRLFYFFYGLLHILFGYLFIGMDVGGTSQTNEQER